MNITGKITHVGEVQSGKSANGKTWSNFTAVIEETEGQYPRSLSFTVMGDKVAVTLGEHCTIHFNTVAKEWNGKYFTNINAWKKEGGAAAAPSMDAPPSGATLPQKPAPAAPMAGLPPMEPISDLPF
jgi:hypothetical protein